MRRERRVVVRSPRERRAEVLEDDRPDLDAFLALRGEAIPSTPELTLKCFGGTFDHELST
ncbi:MAG: hypothetical protein U0414_42000 [Polyangiaceae bacterium]